MLPDRLPFPPPGELPDQGSNPHLLHLLHCRQILYHSHLGSPLNLELYLKIATKLFRQKLFGSFLDRSFLEVPSKKKELIGISFSLRVL